MDRKLDYRVENYHQQIDSGSEYDSEDDNDDEILEDIVVCGPCNS